MNNLSNIQSLKSANVLFRIKRSKKHIDPMASLYCRITVNKVSCEDFSIHKKVCPPKDPDNIQNGEWDSANQKVKGKSEEIKLLNEWLQEIKNTVIRLERDLLAKGKTVTAEKLKTLIRSGKMTATIKECFEELELQQRALLGNGITNSTIKNFVTRKNTFYRFMDEYLKVKDMSLDEITKGVGLQYEVFLKSKGFGQSHVNKCIQFFKRALSYAFDCDYITKNPLQYLKCKVVPQKEIHYIEPIEMKMIEALTLNESLTRVRDIFIFSCETGLAYVDYMSVTSENVAKLDGNLWLVGQRMKSTTQYHVPITPRALEILEKYNYRLPRLSNVKVNQYLKIIGERAGITKKMHTHIGRKTKASMMVNAGVPENTICKVLGLKSIGILRGVYGKLEMKKVAKDMLAASKMTQEDNTVRPTAFSGFRLIRPSVILEIS